MDESIGATKIVLDDFFKLGPEPFTRCDIVGHNDDLAEIWGSWLHVERQHETHRALAHIRGPMLDIGVSDEGTFFEAIHLSARLGDRAVLRARPIDNKFAPVRGWKKLLLNEPHPTYRQTE